MAIQTGMPLGCVMIGAGGVNLVISLSPAISAANLATIVASSYVAAPRAIEVVPKAQQVPSVLFSDIAARVAKLRGGVQHQQVATMAGGETHWPADESDREAMSMAGNRKVARGEGPSAKTRNKRRVDTSDLQSMLDALKCVEEDDGKELADIKHSLLRDVEIQIVTLMEEEGECSGDLLLDALLSEIRSLRESHSDTLLDAKDGDDRAFWEDLARAYAPVAKRTGAETENLETEYIRAKLLYYGGYAMGRDGSYEYVGALFRAPRRAR
jgi:hypothetical protein